MNRNRFRRLKWKVWRWCSYRWWWPWGYHILEPILYPIVWKAIDRPVTRDTDFVIEGYPRSGNGFVSGILRTNGFKVSHHMHSVGNITRAIRLGVPVYLLARHPLNVLASYLPRDEYLTAEDVLRDYCRWVVAVRRLPAKTVFWSNDGESFEARVKAMLHLPPVILADDEHSWYSKEHFTTTATPLSVAQAHVSMETTLGKKAERLWRSWIAGAVLRKGSNSACETSTTMGE